MCATGRFLSSIFERLCTSDDSSWHCDCGDTYRRESWKMRLIPMLGSPLLRLTLACIKNPYPSRYYARNVEEVVPRSLDRMLAAASANNDRTMRFYRKCKCKLLEVILGIDLLQLSRSPSPILVAKFTVFRVLGVHFLRRHSHPNGQRGQQQLRR